MLDRCRSHFQRAQSVSRATGAAPQASPFSVPQERHHLTRATLGMIQLLMMHASVHSRECQSAQKRCVYSVMALHPSKHVEGKTCMCRCGCFTPTTDGCQHHLSALQLCLVFIFKKQSHGVTRTKSFAGYGPSYVSVIFQAATAAEFRPTIRDVWYDCLPA